MNPKFLASLYEQKVIDDQEQEYFSKEKNGRTCRRKLIHHLKKVKKPNVFQSFLEALSSSEQEGIRKDLENDCDSSNQKKRREQWEWQIRLRKYQSSLVERIACRREFLDTFVAQKILRGDEIEMIEYEVTEMAKTAKFLSILRNKSPKAYRVLLSCLQEDESYSDLADKILNTELSEDDWKQYTGQSFINYFICSL